jgi:DNA-binding MarR family transcriptional regulator
MPDTGSLRLGNQLGFALYSTSNSYLLQYRRLLSNLGLTYPQYIVIVALIERGVATNTQLAKKLRLDPSTLTPILRRLVTLDLIQCSRRSHDQRVVDHRLTAKALGMRNALEAVEAGVQRSTGVVDVTIGALQNALQALNNGLITKLKIQPLSSHQRSHPAESFTLLPMRRTVS